MVLPLRNSFKCRPERLFVRSDEAEYSTWIEIGNLTPDQVQSSFGWNVLQAFLKA